MAQRLHDRRASQAVLISSFPCGHSRSAAASEQLDRLRDLLIDERRWGLTAENCIRLADPRTKQEVDVTLKAAGKGVDGGLLLIYYAGHIVLTADRQLYLSLPDTDLDRLGETAIDFFQIKWMVRQFTQASHRLVILDCCHDGLPDPPPDADPPAEVVPARLVAERASIPRTCLLVAAPADHGDTTPAATDHGGFSGDLNRLLTDGLPSGPLFLDVHTVSERIPGTQVEPPARHWLAGVDESIVLARNFALFGSKRIGQVLRAGSFVDEPELTEAVVMILRYDPDEGALGVVINRPGSRPGRDAAPAWASFLSDPPVVFAGGPVEHEGYITLVELRTDAADTPVRFRPVSDAIGTMPLSYEPSAIGATVARSRLFSGYLGWRPGELEADLAQERLVPVAASADAVFSDEPELLWQTLSRPP